MVNLAETFTASAYLCILKYDINDILVHWPPKKFQQAPLVKFHKNVIINGNKKFSRWSMLLKNSQLV